MTKRLIKQFDFKGIKIDIECIWQIAQKTILHPLSPF